MRKKLRVRRFEVKLVEGRIELAPIQDLKELKGKYRDRITASWTKLEEKSDKFVRAGKR